MWRSGEFRAVSSEVPGSAVTALGNFELFLVLVFFGETVDGSSVGPVPGQDRAPGTMEFTASPKPQLSSRANAFSIAALMSSGGSKEKEAAENTIKPLGKLDCLTVEQTGGANAAHPSVPWPLSAARESGGKCGRFSCLVALLTAPTPALCLTSQEGHFLSLFAQIFFGGFTVC